MFPLSFWIEKKNDVGLTSMARNLRVYGFEVELLEDSFLIQNFHVIKFSAQSYWGHLFFKSAKVIERGDYYYGTVSPYPLAFGVFALNIAALLFAFWKLENLTLERGLEIAPIVLCLALAALFIVFVSTVSLLKRVCKQAMMGEI